MWKCLSAFLLCSAAIAQPANPAFLAADVHASKSKGPASGGLESGGRFRIRHATLARMIAMAWEVEPEMVFGGPPWLNEDTFDIDALAPAGSNYTAGAVMLQTLLAERFGLKTHEDRKPVQVFALLPSRRGAQLAKSSADGRPQCTENYTNGPPVWLTYTCQHQTMGEFATELRHLDASITRPVVDQTGLQGAWDINLRFTPLFEFQKAVAAGAASPGVKFFDALDSAGLRLEPREQVLAVLVIDSVNRNPAPNPPDTAAKLPPVAAEFEVAEVKPGKPDSPSRADFSASGRIEIVNWTLKDLMTYAWDLNDDSIADVPKWMETDRYDIIAKAAPGTLQDDLFPMLKALLMDRFKLTLHTEERPANVYFLTAGRNPKLKPADPASRSECTISRGQTGTGAASMPLKVYTCQNTTMARFAELIHPQARGYLRDPVVDRTGLKGGFDFTLSWTRSDIASAAQFRNQGNSATADPTGAVTIFDAVDKLGLKLEGGKKSPLPVLVIDHAERVVEGQ